MPSVPLSLQRERQFFFAMSLLLIATALLGFGYFQYAGISRWDAPWWVHLHAVIQMGWLGFYALQNALVMRGELGVHRKLGQIGAVYGALLVCVGLALSFAVPMAGRGGRALPPPELLAQNLLNILAFAALFAAALAMRRRGDWHKRLMLGAVIVLSLPAVGRITIMLGIPGLPNRLAILLGLIVIAMAFDRHLRGRIHPAYWCGAATLAMLGVLTQGLSQFAPFAAFANGLAP